LPAIGTIARWEPPGAPGLRLDAGVRAGSEVTIYYDSMLAKLIAYGTDRAAADRTSARRARRVRIDGVRTNLPLLRRIVRDDAFRAGDTTTAFLGERAVFLQSPGESEPVARCCWRCWRRLSDPRAWRVAGVGIPVQFAGTERTLRAVGSRTAAAENAWRLEGDVAATSRSKPPATASYRARRGAACAPAGGRASTRRRRGTLRRRDVSLRLRAAALARNGRSRTQGAKGDGTVTAPMPGKIVSVAVKAPATPLPSATC
jgi:acetyl/propionyl-CoA carboxylase alpha subunit